MHILEPGTGGMSWITEEQMLLATIPRLTSLISPASRHKARGPQRSLRGTGGCSIAGMGEGAVLDRDDPIGQGRLVGEGVMLMLPAGWMPQGTHP